MYIYNEINGNISGQALERWSEWEKWILDKLTLNATLPLDIIESVDVSKHCLENENMLSWRYLETAIAK